MNINSIDNLEEKLKNALRKTCGDFITEGDIRRVVFFILHSKFDENCKLVPTRLLTKEEQEVFDKIASTVVYEIEEGNNKF
jgi:hypothetical protein